VGILPADFLEVVAFHPPDRPVELEQEAASLLKAISCFFSFFSLFPAREWLLP
jgi:hypothetical protein